MFLDISTFDGIKYFSKIYLKCHKAIFLRYFFPIQTGFCIHGILNRVSIEYILAADTKPQS